MDDKNIFNEILEFLKKNYGIVILIFISIFSITLLINILIARNIKNKSLNFKENRQVETKIELADPLINLNYDKTFFLELLVKNEDKKASIEKIKSSIEFTDFGKNLIFVDFPDYFERKSLIFLSR
jgi:hypothetical protein